jgi:hypothetical protein
VIVSEQPRHDIEALIEVVRGRRFAAPRITPEAVLLADLVPEHGAELVYLAYCGAVVLDGKPAEPCRCCGYAPELGANWGFHNGQGNPDGCKHVTGERYCDSCSQHWYAEGNESAHDYDLVGDPGEYRGGCATEVCPDCVLAAALEQAEGRAD